MEIWSKISKMLFVLVYFFNLLAKKHKYPKMKRLKKVALHKRA